MKSGVLLDTQLVLWMLLEPRRLSPTARTLLAAGGALWFSTASLWEAAVKHAIGKLPIGAARMAQGCDAAGLRELPLRRAHLAQLERLPALHRDPFDRLLVAQAQAEAMRLASADARVAAYGATVVSV